MYIPASNSTHLSYVSDYSFVVGQLPLCRYDIEVLESPLLAALINFFRSCDCSRKRRKSNSSAFVRTFGNKCQETKKRNMSFFVCVKTRTNVSYR